MLFGLLGLGLLLGVLEFMFRFSFNFKFNYLFVRICSRMRVDREVFDIARLGFEKYCFDFYGFYYYFYIFYKMDGISFSPFCLIFSYCLSTCPLILSSSSPFFLHSTPSYLASPPIFPVRSLSFSSMSILSLNLALFLMHSSRYMAIYPRYPIHLSSLIS